MRDVSGLRLRRDTDFGRLVAEVVGREELGDILKICFAKPAIVVFIYESFLRRKNVTGYAIGS